MAQFEFIRTLLENYGGFYQYDDSEIRDELELPQDHELTLSDIEKFAQHNNMIASNAQAVNSFLEISDYQGWDDLDFVEVRLDFLDRYIDSLTKDGMLHPLQYDKYDISEEDIKNWRAKHERPEHEG